MLGHDSPSVSSVAQSRPTPCNPMNHSTAGLPVHHQLPEFTQTHVHRVGDAIQPSHPLSPLLLLPPIPPSIRVFSNELTLRMKWPKYWSFSFIILRGGKILMFILTPTPQKLAHEVKTPSSTLQADSRTSKKKVRSKS